ncbi:MAG: MEDS domain-containing protein [Actinomycetota bacterium]|nr:MEDS domain-containing protein [Actinomycetota bacterium]
MPADTVHLHRDSAGHLVQFYADEDDLTLSVGTYLRSAIERGGVAIAVATPDHSASFVATLAASGVDVASAQAEGSLVVLDAEHTMRRFLVAQRPDPAAFDTAVGSLIRDAIGRGRPVHVFGEMVALMWQAGHVNAAIELEQMWNELAERLPFTLYCAYSTQTASDEAHRDAMLEVCRLHSAVVGAFGPREAERTFPGLPGSAPIARRFVTDTLTGWGEGVLSADAALVATELTSNAIRHTEAAFTVRLSSSPSGVRIAVRDSSVIPAIRREAGATATSGRGLAMIAAVSNRWHCEPDAYGKVVWAELLR